MLENIIPLLGMFLCAIGALILGARLFLWPSCPPGMVSAGIVFLFGSPVVFLPTTAKFLIGLPLWVLLAVYFNFRHKAAQALTVKESMADRLRAHGAVPEGEDTYRFENAMFTFRVGTGPLFVRNLSVRIAVATDSFYEFDMKRALNVAGVAGQQLAADPFYGNYRFDGMLNPELWDYLQNDPVREVLADLMPGRWRAFSHMFVERVLYDNTFDAFAYSVDDLLDDVRRLQRLGAVPIVRTYRGGVITFRSGFEPDMPAWHWKPEERAALPAGVHRSLFSAYHGNPLVSHLVTDVLYSLGPDLTYFWITPSEDFDYLRYAYGACFESRPPLVITRHPLVPAAADHVTDGRFFHGVIAVAGGPGGEACDMILDRFHGCAPRGFHRAALSVLDRVRFYARRLFDDEHSWYSGEYEILSSKVTPDEVESAVRRIAADHQSEFRRIEGMFSHKMLREE